MLDSRQDSALCHVISLGVDIVAFLILEAQVTSLSMRNVQIELKMMDVCDLTHLLAFYVCLCLSSVDIRCRHHLST